MKLLKKIAPVAATLVMLAAPLAGAVNIADYKDYFTSSTTAVVVGSGTIGTEDIAAALTIADAVGIDTTTTTVGGETYYIEKSSNKFNLGDNISDIKTSIDDNELPTLLAEGTFSDANSAEFEYTQKITFGTTLELTHFADTSYDDKEPTLGIHIPASTLVSNYTLDFKSNPDWDDGDLETATIDIMGKPYYISDVGEAAISMTLIDVSETQTIEEGASTTVNGKVIKVDFIDSTSKVKLVVDGVSTNSLAEGSTYNLGGGKYVAVKDVMYVAKDTGISKVELAFGNGKLDIVNGEEVEINDEDVDGLIGFIANTTTWSTLILQWKTDDEAFITTEESLTMPGFQTYNMGISEIVFPTEEEIKLSGADDAELVVPLISGETTIPLFYLNSTGTGIGGLGSESGSALKTSTTDYIVFNDSADDEGMIVTWVSGEDAESYYVKAETYEQDDINYTRVKDLADGATGYICEDVEEGEACDFGNFELNASNIHYIGGVDEWTNFTNGTAGMSFYTLYSAEGLKFWMPHTTSGTVGFVNTTGDYAANQKWNLTMREEDKDGTLANGDTINLSMYYSSNNKVTVNAIYGDWLGGNYFELQSDDDTYVGYSKSDLATKVTWDTSADEDWALVTYHGEQSYGKVYITSGTGGTTSWTPVKDSETSSYTGMNIIAVGGTAVNKVARKMLGLDENTVVYGTEAGWIDNTGVDGLGKGILWLMTSPYNADKHALLVAGYEGSDTEKTADFLDLKASTLAKEKAVIDTLNSVEASA